MISPRRMGPTLFFRYGACSRRVYPVVIIPAIWKFAYNAAYNAGYGYTLSLESSN